MARAVAQRRQALEADGLAAERAEARAFAELVREATEWDVGEVYQAYLALFFPARRRSLGVFFTPRQLVHAETSPRTCSPR